MAAAAPAAAIGSGALPESEVAKAIAFSADTVFLAKPAAPEQLLEAVVKLLGT